MQRFSSSYRPVLRKVQRDDLVSVRLVLPLAANDQESEYDIWERFITFP
jgi:hypothetical protein